MATPALIATAGATDANTYCTLVEATAYFDTQLYRSNWQGSVTDEQNRALLTATRLLNENFEWNGYKRTEEQSLPWPQYGQVDPYGFDVDYTTIPQFLKDATAELAGHLIGSDRTAEDDTRGFKELQAGTLKLVVDKGDRKKVIPDSVLNMLRSYGTILNTASDKLSRV